MAFSAVEVCAVVDELKNKIVGGRIDKVYQPEKDEIVIGIRTYEEAFRLVLSASSNNARLHLTTFQKKNPKTAPLFCMLLRKHIGSGKITDICQIGFERIVQITIESYNELGDLTSKRLIIEIMGRHSNIVLVDDKDRIIDAVKHVDITISSKRQVLPGLTYMSPPPRDLKTLYDNPHITLDGIAGGDLIERAVLSQVAGISPLIAREVVHNAYGAGDYRVEEVTSTDALNEALVQLCSTVVNKEFKPCTISEENTGRLIEFSAIDIKQYGDGVCMQRFESMSEALDAYYTGRDNHERMRQKSADLFKLLSSNSDRAAKKAIILQNTIRSAERKDEYKIFADLIMANIYRIEQGAAFCEVENYYEPESPKVKINLDTALSPNDNAQRYYKKYRKAKTAEVEAAHQLEETGKEIDYLDQTLFMVESATSAEDLTEIRQELRAQGYLKQTPVSKREKQVASKPRHFVSSDGFDIYVGRSNVQNDYLTLRFANSSDIWFHTKQIHGSHTVIKLGQNKDVPERTMREAACICAYFSKARASSGVPVDYTTIKNVKKPNGARPGMVIYDNYNTVYVTPALTLQPIE